MTDFQAPWLPSQVLAWTFSALKKHLLGLLLPSLLLGNARKGCCEAIPAQTRAFTRIHFTAGSAQDLKETTKTWSQAGAGKRNEKAAGTPHAAGHGSYLTVSGFDSAASRAD